mmetsp:Transcript_21453/g.30290  ORF Transcript_21453/g.30290 Transcript_21453/m.30290 type:complete len:342 (+) Transcript_21453:2487-3512(+)
MGNGVGQLRHAGGRSDSDFQVRSRGVPQFFHWASRGPGPTRPRSDQRDQRAPARKQGRRTGRCHPERILLQRFRCQSHGLRQSGRGVPCDADRRSRGRRSGHLGPGLLVPSQRGQRAGSQAGAPVAHLRPRRFRCSWCGGPFGDEGAGGLLATGPHRFWHDAVGVECADRPSQRRFQSVPALFWQHVRRDARTFTSVPSRHFGRPPGQNSAGETRSGDARVRIQRDSGLRTGLPAHRRRPGIWQPHQSRGLDRGLCGGCGDFRDSRLTPRPALRFRQGTEERSGQKAATRLCDPVLPGRPRALQRRWNRSSGRVPRSGPFGCRRRRGFQVLAPGWQQRAAT